MHVCSEPGCPEIQDARRCPTHTRSRDQARGTRQARGYGPEHDRLRAEWAPRVALGIVRCWRCGRLLIPGEPWDLGHDDLDRTIYRGPECLPCNRATRSRPGGSADSTAQTPLESASTALGRPVTRLPSIPRGTRPAPRKDPTWESPEGP